LAINSIVLDMVAKIAEKLPQTQRRMLCLGYPDMLVTEQQLTAVRADALERVKWRDDSEAILRWHSLTGQMRQVAETRSVFDLLGIEVDFVDIVASRGFEIVMDLNNPAPAEMSGRYDIVYDGGTMEHCFNVGQVMRNIASFTRVGGFIIHVNPINYYNHGFFNFNPTFYHDWYRQSGNEVVSPFYAMHGPVLGSRIVSLDPTAGYHPPERSVMLVAAMKTVPGEPQWPMQTKYLKTPELKG
jgi:SAM-dependent methyltransferase